MAESITSGYVRQTREKDRATNEAWLAEPTTPPEPGVPLPPPLAPVSAPSIFEIPKAGLKATWDATVAGSENFVSSVWRLVQPLPAKTGKTTKEAIVSPITSTASDIGQATLGALQILSALPAGAGAAVEQAMKNYTPGIEKSDAISGSAALYINSFFAVPGLWLSPEGRARMQNDPQGVLDELSRPITYGQLLNIVTQLAAPWLAGKGIKAARGKGGAGTSEALGPPSPPPSTPKDVATQLRTMMDEARAAQNAAKLPETMKSAQEASGRVSEVLRERSRETERTPISEPTRVVPEEPVPAAPTPEGPLKSASEKVMEGQPEKPGDLKSAIDLALERTKAAIDEEIAAAVPEEGGVKVVEGTTTKIPEEGTITNRLQSEITDFVGNALNTEGKGFLPRDQAGNIDTFLLARMATGAALGSTQGDTIEERLANAFLGMGIGAVLSKKLVTKTAAIYKETGLADEAGVLDFSKWRKRPAVQESEKPFQPNYQRLISTPEVERFSKNLHRVIKDDILREKGAPKTHDATERAALKLLEDNKMTPERILNLENDAMLTREEMVAGRMIAHRSRGYVKDLNDKFRLGEVPGQELLDAFSVSAALSKNIRVAQARVAQSLEGMKIKVGTEMPSSYRPEDVVRLADDLTKDMTGQQLSDLLSTLKTDAQHAKVTNYAGAFPRAFTKFMYFSYLSGKSLLRNAIGIVALQPLSVGAYTLAPYMPRWGKAAKSSKIGFGEGPQMGVAWGEAMVDVFQMLKFWNPESQAKLATVRSRFSHGGQQIESQLAGSRTEQAANTLGATFSIPQEILGTTDALGKSVAARMKERTEAMYQATREGLEGADFWKRVDQLDNDPTLLSDLAQERVMEFAEYQTLTKDFEGRILSALSKGPGAEHPWAEMFYRFSLMPFFRTPARGMEAAFLNTPILNVAMKKFWQDMTSGSGRDQQVAQARIVQGGALMALFGYLESQGAIVGDEPDDLTQKGLWHQQGLYGRTWWDPMAQKYRSYEGIAPLSDMIAAGANMSQAMRRMPGDYVGAWWAGAIALATSFDTKQYTQAFSDFLNVIRPGSNDDSIVERSMELVRKRLAGLTPAFLREIESSVDPEKRTVRPGGQDTALSRELDAFKRQVMSYVPGLSTTKDENGNFLVPPDRDRFNGKVIMGETAPFMPFHSHTPKRDKVAMEIIGLDGAGFSHRFPEWVGGAKPSANIGIGTKPEEDVSAGVRLFPQEQDRLAELWTQVIKDGAGDTLEKALEKVIDSPIYQQQPEIGPSGTRKDGLKAQWLRRIDTYFHRMAEAKLLEENPPLAAAVLRQQTERTTRKVPEEMKDSVRQLMQPGGKR